MRTPPPRITLEHPTRRALLSAALLATARRPLAAHADLTGGDQAMATQYASGARASGGRGANTMIKPRSEMGVMRIGGSPLFKPGTILDGVRSEDGSAVDVSFSFPEKWSLSGGPNLDVRDVKTSDSAFLLVAPLPRGKTLEDLPKRFFTDLLFSPQGKYGAYGGIDDYSISTFEMLSFTNPSGAPQPYRRLAVRFDVLTYNQNTVQRKALISATSLGGSVFILVAGSLGSRYKDAAESLASIQTSFRATSASVARRTELETSAAVEPEPDEMTRSRELDGTVGASSVGRIGYRKAEGMAR